MTGPLLNCRIAAFWITWISAGIFIVYQQPKDMNPNKLTFLLFFIAFYMSNRLADGNEERIRMKFGMTFNISNTVIKMIYGNGKAMIILVYIYHTESRSRTFYMKKTPSKICAPL